MTSDARRVRERLSVEDVLAVATRAFAAKGYRGTNLGEVADELGVTRQALYYYFPKKHDVLLALFERFFDHLDQSLEVAADPEHDAAGRFQAMFKAHIRAVAATPALSGIFTKEYENLSPQARATIQQRRRAYQERFVDAYRDGVAQGAFRDLAPGVAVSLLLGAANWTFRWFHPERGASTEELAEQACDFLAGGFMLDGDRP